MLRKRFFGDTLIEVMFAAGIFSMVAISVVALMNNSTSRIQSALESTMTRNEIDAEAEALRYIQSAYVAELSVKAPVKTYSAIWNKIKEQAVEDESVMNFAPHSCAELYENNGEAKKYGFVLNYRNLYANEGEELNPASVLFTGHERPNLFKEALLYPRLMFNNKDDLYEGTNIAKNLTAAEGVYIVAMKDLAKTNVVDTTGIKDAAAFFDFYIRSCWQAPGSDVPTVVSTVIRLYDPDVTK